ncbi:hypothetical protein ACJIZ3_017276 [Penstemon smallii]|uniref:Transmembrane protein n=1 Tax=Penstemon smallii TaxID=265156 RepID=A0ABD3SV38_9LAMI
MNGRLRTIKELIEKMMRCMIVFIVLVLMVTKSAGTGMDLVEEDEVELGGSGLDAGGNHHYFSIPDFNRQPPASGSGTSTTTGRD